MPTKLKLNLRSDKFSDPSSATILAFNNTERAKKCKNRKLPK